MPINNRYHNGAFPVNADLFIYLKVKVTRINELQLSCNRSNGPGFESRHWARYS